MIRGEIDRMEDGVVNMNGIMYAFSAYGLF